VIQRLIHCAGGDVVVEDDDKVREETLEPTEVLLFCREEAKPYVFCGELTYLAHDPDRIPVRFVWQLADFDTLQTKRPFTSLVDACNAILAPTTKRKGDSDLSSA